MKKKTTRAAALLLTVSMLAGCFSFDDDDITTTANTTSEIAPDDITDDTVTVYDDDIIIENDGDTVTYNDNNGMELVMEPAKNDDVPAAKQSGTTRDGKKWKADDKAIVVGDKKVTVKSNAKNKDNGKIAGVAGALDSKNGYTKGANDCDQNYAVYYIQAAECLLYYPKQLKLVKEGEDQSLLFRDPKSSAELKVTIDENEYSCMDDVESFIANSEYSLVLASGTDWFSAEKRNKNTTEFTLTGLGNVYAVNACLTYENKYDFVFNELRGLMKCRFIGGGIWVSNAREDTTGKKVKALEKQEGAYDPVLTRTSYYLDDMECVISYPDIFTKVYRDDDGTYCFTDPVTGAHIIMDRTSSPFGSVSELQDALIESGAIECELMSDHSLRAASDNEIVFCVLRDGWLWGAAMDFESKYSGIYSAAYDMLEISIQGDSADNTEMKEIYFPPFGCYVTVPVQFEEYGMDGDVHLIKDILSGLEARLTFTKINDSSDADNLFELFHVAADDGNMLLGEDYVKWHNIDGLFLGAAGRKYAALLELSYPNAYAVYKDCWQSFGISFESGGELVTDGDKIRQNNAAANTIENSKKEIITMDSDPAQVYKPSEKKQATKPATAEKMKELGVDTPSKSDSGDSSGDSGKVKLRRGNDPLIYKKETDYEYIIIDDDFWLNGLPVIYDGDEVDIEGMRRYILLYMMDVLAYNGYDLPSKAAKIAWLTNEVNTYLEMMQKHKPIDSTLGHNVIPVFEVLCAILGIAVPDYYLADDGSGDSGNSGGSSDSRPDNTQAKRGTLSEVAQSYSGRTKKLIQALPFYDWEGLMTAYERYYFGRMSHFEYEASGGIKKKAHELIDSLLLDSYTVVDSYGSEEYGREYYYLKGVLDEIDSVVWYLMTFDDTYMNVTVMDENGDGSFEPGSVYYFDYEGDITDLIRAAELSMSYLLRGMKRAANITPESYYIFELRDFTPEQAEEYGLGNWFSTETFVEGWGDNESVISTAMLSLCHSEPDPEFGEAIVTDVMIAYLMLDGVVLHVEWGGGEAEEINIW